MVHPENTWDNYPYTQQISNSLPNQVFSPTIPRMNLILLLTMCYALWPKLTHLILKPMKEILSWFTLKNWKEQVIELGYEPKQSGSWAQALSLCTMMHNCTSQRWVLELTLALFLVLFHLNPALSAALLPSLLLTLTLPLFNVICELVRLLGGRLRTT